MIHPDVLFEHIDINQARNFVDISKIAQPNPIVLYVLHEKGKVLKAWHSQKGRVSVGETIQPSVGLVEELKKSQGVDEVQLIDQQGFRDYYKQALDLNKAQELTGYDFKERTKQLKNTQGTGLIIYPPRESYDYYHYIERSRKFVAEKLKSDCVFLLGVYDSKGWWTSLVADFTGGQIMYLSTFEYFPAEKLASPGSPQTHESLVKAAAQGFKKPAFGMFLPKADFESFAKNQWRGLGQTPLLQAKP
jgi:hypothetical protein